MSPKYFWRDTLIDSAILREWIVNVGQRPAPSRLAHTLVELRRRLASSGRAAGDTFEMPLTQEQISEALGITPVHANRIIRQLRDDEDRRDQPGPRGGARRGEACGVGAVRRPLSSPGSVSPEAHVRSPCAGSGTYSVSGKLCNLCPGIDTSNLTRPPIVFPLPSVPAAPPFGHEHHEGFFQCVLPARADLGDGSGA